VDKCRNLSAEYAVTAAINNTIRRSFNMQTIKLGDVRYNATMGAFEARVDVVRDGRTFRYPCQMAGPVDLPHEVIAAGLTNQAVRMSDSGASLMSTFH